MAGSFSVEQICSKALGLLGEKPITDLDQTTNPNAVRCAQLYAVTRDALLSEYAWGFATRRVMLEMDATVPAFGFSYQFVLPADKLRVQKAHDKSIKYVLEGDRLLTDASEVGIVYTRRIEEPGYFDALFTDCLSARMARELAMPILKKLSAVQVAEGLYKDLISSAKRVDAMQDYDEPESESSWLSAR